MTACWHPTVGPLELRRLDARLELRSEESLLATIEAPGDGWLRLHADGQTWRLVEYKPGWHFALMGDTDGETRAADAPLLILLACAIAVQQLWMGVSWTGE